MSIERPQAKARQQAALVAVLDRFEWASYLAAHGSC